MRVRRASKVDQGRYDKLLAYIEKKREKKKLKEDEDKQRMEKMKQKEQRWSLMREAVKFLRENDMKWQERKIEEWGRIKLEEKKDRLAMVEIKKGRYGAKLAKLTKDENSKIRMRTEERKEMAVVMRNLWRKCREMGDENDIDEEERLAWEKIHDCLENEDEKDTWTEIKTDPEHVKKLLKRKVHLVVRPENETEDKVTTSNDNLKTITHITRQENPKYILHTYKEDPSVTKNSGGSLVTDLVRQFEGWAPDAPNERLYRFGDNTVEESPHKRQRRHTPVISSPVRTPTRRSSRPVRTQTRWTGSPSLSRRICSETLATRSTLPRYSLGHSWTLLDTLRHSWTL